MKKWDYILLECSHGRHPSIDSINGNPPTKIEADNVTIFGGRGKREPYLFEYLQVAGNEGWEVCGVSPTTQMHGDLNYFCVILKRAIELD